MNIDENNNRDNLLMEIVVYINEKLSYDFQQSVDNVIMLICDQIQQYHAIIGDVEYLDYIKENLPHHKGLSIYGSGNPILDNTRVGNLFMEIDRLKAEFNNSAHKEQNNSTQGSFIFHHFIKNAEKVIKESGVDYHLRDVKHWLNDITNHLRQVPSDYKHLERWFALMEDHATTNTQRYDFGQLKEHFEQLKQQPTPQDETTSSQLLAAQVEDAGGEVETGTKQLEIILPFKEQALDKLYDLMITEEVFSSSITKDTFFKCIDSANFKVIWDKQKKPEKTKRNQLRCVIRYLKDHYKSVWIECAAKNLGMPDKRYLTAFNRQSMGDFENKVTNLLA